MVRKYIPSGEGYWCNAENPSEGCVGMPSEIERSMQKKWEEESSLDESLEKLKIGKAMKLIRESGARDMNYKISFLEELRYKQVKVKGDTIDLRKAVEKYPQNIDRMYNNVIKGLRDFVKNPKKESKLIERLDTFQ